MRGWVINTLSFENQINLQNLLFLLFSHPLESDKVDGCVVPEPGRSFSDDGSVVENVEENEGNVSVFYIPLALLSISHEQVEILRTIL